MLRYASLRYVKFMLRMIGIHSIPIFRLRGLLAGLHSASRCSAPLQSGQPYIINLFINYAKRSLA